MKEVIKKTERGTKPVNECSYNLVNFNRVQIYQVSKKIFYNRK